MHALVILAFMALIPASKHLHLVLSPITVFLKSPELGNLPNLDFEKEQVGLETVKDLGSKIGARRVHLRRVRALPGELPGVGRRQGAQPEDDHPADAGRAARRASASAKLGEVYSEKVLWQCTTCGACENQCPVGIEHLPILIGSRRGLVSNGDAPDYLGAMYNNLERRSNIWGLGYDQRHEVRAVGRARDLRPGEARRAGLARLRRIVRRRLPEVAAIAVRHPAREGA